MKEEAWPDDQGFLSEGHKYMAWNAPFTLSCRCGDAERAHHRIVSCYVAMPVYMVDRGATNMSLTPWSLAQDLRRSAQAQKDRDSAQARSGN
mgnify:CR=1 FL=1